MENRYSLKVTRNELNIIREVLHSVNIRGTDAHAVGMLLDKVYTGIQKLDTPTSRNSGDDTMLLVD